VLAAIPRFLEPIGTLWVNALRMTVIPLVVSAILIGITSMPDPRHVGRIGGRALLTFLVVLSVASAFATVVGPFVLAWLNIDSSAASTLLSTATSASDLVMAGPKTIGVGQWVSDLLPANPVKAAADGAMLQLIVFALLVGVAVGRIEESRRQPLMRVVRVVYEAGLTLVEWVLVAAPVGVFALAASLATKLGIAAAGAVAFYVGAVSAMTLCFALLFYPVAWLVGKRTLPDFARACAPAQAVAFSSRSSLVSLPALLQGAHDVLRLPLSIRSFVLPLAVAMFRPAGAIAIPMGVLFVARLYGIELTPPQLVAVALAAVLTTFSAPGIPGGSILVMVPVLLSAGLPAEAVGLLIGVDAIPDMVRTVTNVTGDMAVAAIVARFGDA
jgi:Na+/H+-dicarboxylate symporter